jgi:hypothetical protein
MYDKALATSGVASLAALPGHGFNAVWFVLAVFALVMACGAVLRIAPRRQA